MASYIVTMLKLDIFIIKLCVGGLKLILCCVHLCLLSNPSQMQHYFSAFGLLPVPSGYPNPTGYPIFLSIPDPIQF